MSLHVQADTCSILLCCTTVEVLVGVPIVAEADCGIGTKVNPAWLHCTHGCIVTECSSLLSVLCCTTVEVLVGVLMLAELDCGIGLIVVFVLQT